MSEYFLNLSSKEQKVEWSGYTDTSYGACSSGELSLIPSDDAIGELEKDYRGMKGMLYGEAVSFEQILSSLGELELKINELTTA